MTKIAMLENKYESIVTTDIIYQTQLSLKDNKSNSFLCQTSQLTLQQQQQSQQQPSLKTLCANKSPLFYQRQKWNEKSKSKSKSIETLNTNEVFVNILDNDSNLWLFLTHCKDELSIENMIAFIEFYQFIKLLYDFYFNVCNIDNNNNNDILVLNIDECIHKTSDNNQSINAIQLQQQQAQQQQPPTTITTTAVITTALQKKDKVKKLIAKFISKNVLSENVILSEINEKLQFQTDDQNHIICSYKHKMRLCLFLLFFLLCFNDTLRNLRCINIAAP